MTRWLLLGSVLLAAGCTKQNPAARCSTGTCIDPAYPFCDVDGALSGSAGSCISVSCTPGDFKVCRGDVALTCNAMGNNYDELQCQMGCTPEANGCKLCQAGETVCANGEVQVCDANGAVTQSQPCPLGCFDSEPRCRELDPSNGFATYADMVPNPVDLDFAASGSINTGTGTISLMGVTVPSFLIAAPNGGNPVRVFVVHNFHIEPNVTVQTVDSTDTTGTKSTAFALVATGDITIEGTLNAIAGGHSEASCDGGRGVVTDTAAQPQAGASGGGGFATAGADGGYVAVNGPGGGTGGGVSGNQTLVPLRGGCAAGGYINDNDLGPVIASPGGGAVQLSAGGKLSLTGLINADGSEGYYEQATSRGGAIYGGGAGGGILLEGATIELGPTGMLLARGGGGAADSADYIHFVIPLDGNPIPGETCYTPSMYCGNGGAGAAPGVDAKPGGASAYSTSSSVTSETGGGGGGGLGRIRINTQSGTYTKANTSVEAGALTTGVVGTR